MIQADIASITRKTCVYTRSVRCWPEERGARRQCPLSAESLVALTEAYHRAALAAP